MSHYTIIILLIAGGGIGWSLFVYTLIKLFCNRQKEIQMIDEITIELIKVRAELQELK